MKTNMIDMNLHRKVELTYKDLYELTFVFPIMLRDTDTEKVRKWAREHPLITDIGLELMDINNNIKNIKYSIEKDKLTDKLKGE